MSISEDQTSLYPSVELTTEVQGRIKELQALITENQRRADKTEDEDLREAFNLQVSKLGLMVARLRRGQPEELPIEVETAVEEEFEPLPKPTAEQLHEADMLIQRAALERRRGNKQLSADLMKQAADVAPGASSVLEAVGDDLVERRQFAAAREAYKSAHRADPENASVERKIAHLSMSGMADLTIEQQLQYGSFDSPFINQNEALASPWMAVALSCVIPGLGQFVLGQSKKGGLLFAIFVVSLTSFILLAKLHPAGVKNLPTFAYLPAAIAAATWFGAVADATSHSKAAKMREIGRAKGNRPVPPVNLPFE